jgi:hypothetical protein
MHREERAKEDEREMRAKVYQQALHISFDHMAAVRLPHIAPSDTDLTGKPVMVFEVGSLINYTTDSVEFWVYPEYWSKNADLFLSIIYHHIKFHSLLLNHPSLFYTLTKIRSPQLWTYGTIRILHACG